MKTGELNLEWARRIVGALVESGLAEAGVAPGSRSAPLVLAMAEFPELRVRVHLDERSAGFFALGYGRRARRPAAVVTTSGTAVANLLPSVVEASASDVPVILLTADRPRELRGADAHQTIDQVGIFGPRLRWEADLPEASEAGLAAVGEAARTAFACATGPPAGPVHLNIPFDKPVEPESAASWRRGLERRSAENARRGRMAGRSPGDLGGLARGGSASGRGDPASDQDGLALDQGRSALNCDGPKMDQGGPALDQHRPASDQGEPVLDQDGLALDQGRLALDQDGPALDQAGSALSHGLASGRFGGAVEAGAELVKNELARARRPVLVAGASSDPDGEGPALIAFSARLGVPLLADPLSGARFAGGGAWGEARLIGGYDHFLRVPGVSERLAPDLVLRTGRTPTSAVLENALAGWRAGRQVVIDAGGTPKDHQGLADAYVRAPAGPVLDLAGRAEGWTGLAADEGCAGLMPDEGCAGLAADERRGSLALDEGWAGLTPDEGRAGLAADEGCVGLALDEGWARAWSEAEAATWEAVEDGLAGDAANEGAYAAAVLGALPEGATLFVSSSMPVRDVDAFGRPAPLGIRVLGNRGANGIDGIVSSALGCAAAGEEPVACLLGDLALHHDLNGLLAARDPELGVVFVVIDNDGGGIFHMLPIREFEPAFTPCFATPHGLDFRHAARLHGLAFADADGPAQLAEIVGDAAARRATQIVRVRTEAGANRLRHEAVRRRVARALAGFGEGAAASAT